MYADKGNLVLSLFKRPKFTCNCAYVHKQGFRLIFDKEKRCVLLSSKLTSYHIGGTYRQLIQVGGGPLPPRFVFKIMQFSGNFKAGQNSAGPPWPKSWIRPCIFRQMCRLFQMTLYFVQSEKELYWIRQQKITYNSKCPQAGQVYFLWFMVVGWRQQPLNAGHTRLLIRSTSWCRIHLYTIWQKISIFPLNWARSTSALNVRLRVPIFSPYPLSQTKNHEKM